MTDAALAAWRWWFGLTDLEAQWLGLLYERGEAWVSTLELQGRFKVSAGAVRQRIHHLRMALECEAIDCDPGQGYRLTETGRGECRGVLWQMGEELRRA